MPCSRLAVLVTAAAFALPALPALAQTIDAPAADAPAASAPAAPAKPASRKAAARAKAAARKAKAAARAPDPAPEAAGRSAILGPSTDTGTRHRGLSAAPDEDPVPGQPDGPPVGITLGGSGGLTPGMGMKF